MGETFDVRIERLVYGGDAIGKLADGRTVFVPYAIPGELVRINLVEEKPRFARGEPVEVLEASAQREIPRCSHFMYCGGCHYQHMNYAAQLEAKSAILQEQLERIGGVESIPAAEIIAAPEPWYYRNQIQFHQTREGKLGYQRARSNRTFAIRECHLPENSINLTWPQIDIEPIHGLERISLRGGMNDDLMLILESTNSLPLDFSIEGLSISVIQKSPQGSLVLAGSDQLSMHVLEKQFVVSSGSFFQVNTHQAEAMVKHIMDHMPLNNVKTILDVYSGVGLFSAFLAQRVKELIGIEVSPEACEDYTRNLDEFENVSLYEASAEEVLDSIRFGADTIVVDPPREGLGAKTVEAILAQGAHTLVYVSCDPATLARDARQLTAGGYQLNQIALLDMFPQTYHIESISYWRETA
jgi:23S rRNA (uracil1939-C5)-methyltransferase